MTDSKTTRAWFQAELKYIPPITIVCRPPAQFVLNLPSKYWRPIKWQRVRTRGGVSPQFRHIYSFVYGHNNYITFRNYLENLLRHLISCYTEVWRILSLVFTRGEDEQQVPVQQVTLEPNLWLSKWLMKFHITFFALGFLSAQNHGNQLGSKSIV
jgi:hypothetical protein